MFQNKSIIKEIEKGFKPIEVVAALPAAWIPRNIKRIVKLFANAKPIFAIKNTRKVKIKIERRPTISE
jgi:hypothetical protein